MGGGDGGGASGWGLKTLFGALVLVFFLCLLSAAKGSRPATTYVSNQSAEQSVPGAVSLRNFRRLMLVRKASHFLRGGPNLVYVSKRRVPSGPDPIHNRHVGESRRAPGRV